MKIAILYICTGKYKIFWKDFYISCEEHFIKEFRKEYFVFTDSEKIDFEDDNSNIHRIYQNNLGWPKNTLLRFEMFKKIKEKLKDFDFIFFFNANIVFTKKITGKEFLPVNNDLLLVKHPGYYKFPKNILYPFLPLERNNQSLAFVPYNKKTHYYMGGINGGKGINYIKLIEQLSKNIKIDLNNNIIAKWHDESHLNSYVIDKNKKILSPNIYGFAQNGKNLLNKEAKIIILDKNNFGGHTELRRQ